MSRATRAHWRAHSAASVSTRPLGPDQIEVATRCRHATFRIGFALDAIITARVTVAAAVMHHATMAAPDCRCMDAVWPRLRTPSSPADLAGLRERFNRVWAGIEAQNRAQGSTLVDWPAAVREVTGRSEGSHP